MGVHESSVNFQNLIRDLAEMYPFDVSEVVVVELVANSLDAKATCISISFDPATKVLAVQDNGEGMTPPQFEEYHDFAAGLKTRGTGIGFAGVGAKISFNIADRVVTETRSKSFLGGSDWHLQSKKRLVWEDVQPSHMREDGTRVEVRFRSDAKLAYSGTKDLIRLLRRHYLPLLDPAFLELYERMGYYSNSFRFEVDGQIVEPGNIDRELAVERVKSFFPTKAGKRIGYGLLGLATSEYPLGGDVCGVLLCTRGKVIKADLFNQFPGTLGPRVFGVVEIPGLVDFLTTAKTDFIRGRGRFREFEGLYDPVRQEFKAWLAELGVQSAEIPGIDEAGKLERELKKILDDVPELSEFFGFRTRKPVLVQSDSGAVTAATHEGVELTFPMGEGHGGGALGPVDVGDQPGEALVLDPSGTEKAQPISRQSRRGPKIAFADARDRLDLAWIDGNNVVINSAHPSYAKARSDSLARRLHCLFAIGSAVQRFIASGEDATDLMFVDRMMAAWGKK